MPGPEEAALLAEAREIVDPTGKSNLDWEDFDARELRELHRRGTKSVDERAKDMAEAQFTAARELGDRVLQEYWRTYVDYMND